MATPAYTPDELRSHWAEYAAAGYNFEELARRKGGSVQTWKSRVSAAKARLKKKVPADAKHVRKERADSPTKAQLRACWDVYAEHNYNASEAFRAQQVMESRPGFVHRLDLARSVLGVQEPPLDSRERLRLRDEAMKLRNEVREALRLLNEAEDLRQAVFHLAAQPLVPPEWVLKPGALRNVPGLPILFTSDFQWGEKIDSATLGGVNEFNKDVASRRYKTLIEKTLELSFEHMPRAKYDGLLYLRGGDMISGEIHADLRESNDLQSVPAVKDLVEHECAGIESLVRKFGKVHVVSVPGNHGRITPKPQSKGAIERNLDTLSAWWLESHFKADKRVTFWTPPSGDALMPVYGYNFLMTHGDRIGSRGGEGFIGAVATITRGMKKTADFYASIGVTVDLQFIGHFHTALDLEYGFANGSLPGYSEYARDLRMRVQPPKQWLVFAHPRHVVGARWQILLEPRARMDG